VAKYYAQLLLKYQTPEWNVLLDVAEYVRPFMPKAQVREITDAVKLGAPADIAEWQAKRQKYEKGTDQDPTATRSCLVAVSESIVRAGKHALMRVEALK
jgi:hypothetical protein